MWRRFFSLEGPLARLYSAFATLGGKKYIIGGASYPENLVLNDIWSLSFEHVVWDSTSLDLPGVLWEKIEPQEGTMPHLKAHAAIQVDSTKIFLFGGYNQKGECTDSTILFDVEKRRVIPFETKGTKPAPRAFHVKLNKETI